MADSQVRLTQALASAVEEMGRRVADRPDRLRAVLLDELGANAREHRAGVDALVAAAQAEVPTALLRRRRGQDAPDDAALSALVADRDVEPADASYAVRAWSSALRVEVPAGAGEPDDAAEQGDTGPEGAGALGVGAGPAGAGAGAVTASAGTASAETVLAGQRAGSSPPGAPRPDPSPRSPAPGPGRPGGLVLRWWSVAALLVVMLVVAGGAGWLAGQQGRDDTATASSTTGGIKGMPGMTGSSPSSATPAKASAAGSPTTTAAPTSAPAPSPSAPPSPVPLTAADTSDPDFTPVLTDAAANTWQVQPLSVTSTGTFDRIEVVSQLEKHGLVNVGADGMVDGTTLTYQPKHNGDFWDHITIRLHDTASGAVSNDATITVHALCAPASPATTWPPGRS